MPANVNHGRYVCDTCECVFDASLKPIIVKQSGKELMSASQALRFVEVVENFFDRYWWGSQGITTQDFLKGLREYAAWRLKHKCHRVRTLRYNEHSPTGYSVEKLGDAVKIQ